MDYRDDRDALRMQKEALEEELVQARADADGKKELEAKLREAEKELAKLRPEAVADPPANPARFALIGGAVVVTAVAAGMFVMTRGAEAVPPVAIPTATAIATAVEPAPIATLVEAPPTKLAFSLGSGGLAAFNGEKGDAVMAVTFEDTPAGRAYSAVALAGDPLTIRYRLGPYGAREPRVWASGRRALMIDDAHKAHVIDTTDGREIAEVTGLTDAPSRVCIRDLQAWIATIDGGSIGVNLESGAGSVGAARLKSVCPPLPDSKHNACATISAPFCGGGGPSVPGFATKVVASSDAVGVALGVKSPGTPDVLAVGFDPKTRAVPWKAPIAEDDDAAPLAEYPPIVAALDDDLFVAIERLKSGKSKLRGFDAKSGASRFTTTLAPDKLTPPLSLAIGSDRVFVTVWGRLFVFDRKTGEPRQTLGTF